MASALVGWSSRVPTWTAVLGCRLPVAGRFDSSGIQTLALHIANDVLAGALIRRGAAGSPRIGTGTVLRRRTVVSRPVSGTGRQDDEGPREGGPDQYHELFHGISPFRGLCFRSLLAPRIATGHKSKPSSAQVSQRLRSSAKRE